MKITEKDVERMAALRAEGLSYKKIAEVVHCGETSVKRHLYPKKDEVAEKAELKKEEEFRSMMEYLQSRKGHAVSTCDNLLAKIDRMTMDDESMMGFKVTLAQLTTAFGTIVDKFGMVEQGSAGGEDTGICWLPEASDGDY